MRKVNQEQFNEVINCNEKVAVVLTQENCPVCKNLKQVLLVVREELPLTPFVEFQGEANVYPVNELSEKFGFKTVPVVVIYKNGNPVKTITSIHLPNYYVKEIKEV